MRMDFFKFRLRPAPRWGLVLLLLVVASAGFASMVLGSGGNPVPGSAFLLQTSFDPQDAASAPTNPDTEAEAAGGAQIPPWLQIILTVGIALLIYYFILMIIRRRQNTAEEIIHVKSREGDSGYSVEQPGEPVSIPEKQPPVFRVPPQQPSGGARRPQTAKKNSSWGLVVAIIVILNVIRRCIQND